MTDNTSNNNDFSCSLIIPTRDNFLVKRKLKEFISKSPVETIVVQDNDEIHLPLGSDEIIVK